MKARRAELRERIRTERAALRAKMRELHADRDKRRRRIAFFVLLVILLWLLLRGCDCEPEPEPEPGPGGPRVGVWLVDAGPAPPPPPPPRARKPRKKRLKPKPRPTYEPKAPPPRSWLADFRLQVAARAPRLSRCFEGADAPGALKWTAAVDIARGVVSDHQFEAVLTGATLSKPLRRCLVGVLAKPAYRLSPDAKQPTPSRVSIIIEF